MEWTLLTTQSLRMCSVDKGTVCDHGRASSASAPTHASLSLSLSPTHAPISLSRIIYVVLLTF